MSDDINVNEIADQLNGKVDLPNNTNQSSVDFVVESKFPTTDDPTWYRVYKSGWVEQGGVIPSVLENVYTAATITFPKVFKDTNYYVNVIEWHNGQRLGMNEGTGGEAIYTKATNSCVITCYSWTYGRMWEAKGMKASS